MVWVLPKSRLLCAPMPNRNSETEILEEEMAVFFCQAEGKTQQASASRTVPPPPSGIRKDFICGAHRVYDKDQNSEVLAFFFLH